MTRIVPTADVLLHCSPSGSDATGDGSAVLPFRNPQAAADLLYRAYDFAGEYRATIQLEVAPVGQQYAYEGVALSGRLVGQGGCLAPLVVGPGLPVYPIGKYRPLTLQGDPTGQNPAGAIIVGRDKPPVSLSDGAALKITGFAVDTGTVPFDCIDVFGSSFLDFSYIWFGNAGPPPNSYNVHIGAADGARLWQTGPYWITGSAASHMQLGSHSSLNVNNNTGQAPSFVVTVSGGLNFPSGFVIADNSEMYVAGIRYSGSPCHGPTCVILRNGVIDTNAGSGTRTGNANFFPGDLSPIIQDNAVYR